MLCVVCPPGLWVILELVQAAAPTTIYNIRLRRLANNRRDGTIDGSVVAHEWGHYLHHRLTNCVTPVGQGRVRLGDSIGTGAYKWIRLFICLFICCC